ncbi:ATP-binding protein [Streptomyces calidiresistens]|uniref:ATP-binding protein n=1 Tax=Streptomyces calidiresistens TaxID=1485586 RepID=A0A7W3XWW6_9ACTN|nr:ATP-binding protein [Streptomyces calidiresistens]MBB0230196.1 ATP-binding protein [Streptomyces calidiresistens]
MYPPSSAPLRPSIEVFRHVFPATPEAARHARHLVDNALRLLGIEEAGAVRCDAVAVVAELTANAATHGCVSGQGFEVVVLLIPGGLRVEVGDPGRGGLPTALPGPPEDTDAESGRGLRIVATLAHRWGVIPNPAGAPGKTVWAEVLRRRPESVGEAP